VQDQIPAVEDTYLARQFGLFELLRRVREDQLSVLTPAVFARRLIRFRLLRVQYFVVNWPDYIEHVLLTNAQNYVKGRFAEALLGPIVGEGLLISEGEAWRRRRRIEAPAFHHRSIAGLVDEMAHCTRSMLARWDRRTEPFDVASEMTDLTLDIITRTMFSTDLGDDVARLRQLMQTVLRLDRPSVADMLGLPRWMRIRSKTMRQAVAELDRMVERVLASRRQAGGEHGDLLALLLAARDEESGEGLDDHQLRDEIMTIFFAGHETTANALSFTWYLLATHPDVDAKLQEELEHVLGGRAPVYADIARLRYTRMVFEEALRLYPPAYSMGRTAVAPDVIGGVTVPKGAIISIYPYVTHRNPALWPDPERFDPERFAPDGTAGRHRFAYFPFGGGPRICIGQGFAMAEAAIVIATVAQRFRFSVAPGHTVEPIGLLTLRPKNGVWVMAAPRQTANCEKMSADAGESSR
jgi:cytochrome P450